MRKILQLKSWHLFALCLFSYLRLPSPLEEIIGLITAIIIGLWMYSVGYYGETRLRMMGIAPKNLLFYQVNNLYLAAMVFFLFTVFIYWGPENINRAGIWIALVVILLLYAIFAAFQILFFTSQTLAELETGKPASFKDYRLNLLLFIVFIVGAWILVPKVRKYLVEEYDEVNPFESI